MCLPITTNFLDFNLLTDFDLIWWEIIFSACHKVNTLLYFTKYYNDQIDILIEFKNNFNIETYNILFLKELFNKLPIHLNIIL